MAATVNAPTDWRTADEYARVALGQLSPGQRGLVFVVDPDQQLSWPEDGGAAIEDGAGRSWRLLGYRGNDLALRARYRAGTPTVIWVRPAPLADARSIDLTTLADLVGLADAFVDSSLAGMLASRLPGIPLPDEVGEWAPEARTDPPAFATALARVLEYRGKPVSRRHVLAAATLQAAPKTSAELAWLDDSDLVGLATSYIHLLALDHDERFRAAAGAALWHVAALLSPRADQPRPTEAVAALARVPGSALLPYLYVLAAARRRQVPSPLAAAQNHGLTPPELLGLLKESERFAALLVEVADEVNLHPEVSRALAIDAERGRDAAWLGRLGDVLAGVTEEWASEPAAAARLILLARTLEADQDADRARELAPVEPAFGAPRFVRAVEGLERIARTLARHAGPGLAAGESTDLESLVQAYVGGAATAEFDLATAERDLRPLAPVLGDVRKLAERIATARSNTQASSGDLDGILATILRRTPASLSDSPRALARWLPRIVAPEIRADPDRRLWLLVFDGLRWDLWERVLRPELEREGWQADVEAGLTLLPSETSLCRRALLAGSPPTTWGTSGQSSSEESLVRQAFARWYGKEPDLDYRLKSELLDGYLAERPGPARVNVRVFRTPDWLVHHGGGDLLDVASQFRAFLRENVLPELRVELEPSDRIFLGTDHGFTGVFPDRVKTVAIPADRVNERVVELGQTDDASVLPGLTVAYPGLGRWQVATGDWAFAPLGEVVSYASLRHGGASLRELVVPLVQLRPPVRVTGGLELELRGPDEIGEDAEAAYVARLTNPGGDAVRGQLVLETNLETLSRPPVSVATGGTAERRFSVRGREGLETVSVRFVARDVTVLARTRAVRVRLKPGIKLSGLEKLDDDW